MHKTLLGGFAIIFGLAIPANAQSRFVLNDRDTDSMFRGFDSDGNLSLNDPGEINLWFSAANLPGTLGPMNPTCLDVSHNAIVAMGDQINRNVYKLCDLNDDGDVQDAGESIVFADATNLSLFSFAFPTGAAFDSHNRTHIVNAGNSFGNDRIFRLVDLNGDGDAQDTDEITEYVGEPFFGPGNGSFSPQEIFFTDTDVLYLRNSSANLHGVWRFEDLNANGRADDPGEATVFFDATNGSGLPVTAGFALEPDRVRDRSIYTLQLASGGVDQLVRLSDLNDDGDAQDAGEAVLVWSTAEAGFTTIDLICLYNGDVLITDNSAKRVIRLHDGNTDDLFDNATERTTYYTAPGTGVVDLRQMSILPVAGDINFDGVRNAADLAAFADVLIGVDTAVSHRIASDLNRDGPADGLDIDKMTRLFIGP